MCCIQLEGSDQTCLTFTLGIAEKFTAFHFSLFQKPLRKLIK